MKLALRASEIRSEIKRLDPGEEHPCQAPGAAGEVDAVEMEYPAARTAEAEEEVERRVANGLTPEERERRELENRAKFRNALHVVVIDRALTDATGAGGIKRRDSGEGIGEELESLAVLDRRIAKMIRSRIAWFEAVANGSVLPQMETW